MRILLSNRKTYCLAALILLVPRYGCHKPTNEESFAQAKHCFAALEANLSVLSRAQFKQAGMDRDDVKTASLGNMEAAYDSAKELKKTPAAASQELDAAKLAYLKAHSWQDKATGGWKFQGLGSEINNCMGDYFGRPND